MKKLLLLLLVSIAALGCTTENSLENPDGEKVLLVSFDGFRYDYLEKADTPNFDRLVESGVISEGLIPVFPSKTFPNYYAIATGLYPENNGFVGNNMYDAEMRARFSIGNREAVENPDWYEGEPIWNTVEKAGKNAGTMFWVGSEAPIQNMRPTHWKEYDQSLGDSSRIDTVLKWMTLDDVNEVDLATLYFHFVDSEGHRHGTDSPEVIQAIERADDLIGYLIQRMKSEAIMEQTNILIVSDHGMSEVSKERIIVLDDMIDPEDLEIIAYSPAMMANVKGGNIDEVYNALKENEDHFKVYKKEEIPDRYHLKGHHRVPELLLVADPGYTINSRTYFEANPDYPSGGTHGFDNQHKEMHALFVGNGPDFKNGYTMEAFENIHIYNLIAHLLNVEPAENDGDVNRVSVMLE